VRRIGVAIIAGLFAVGAIAPATFAASATTTKSVPRVVFIVGPAGAATAGYRAQARAAATIARRYTPDVTELYSPDATWPAVKEALAGASLVVYMGHGNGWPSPYRDELYPPTQNGFGLNPAPGGGDSTHQYFGEAAVGTQIKLAKNAVVLLNHLCYASGNSEPGLPEGTFDQARQRVDNFAAGFIEAGAAAVIAEAWSSPSYFVTAILGGGRSIQNAWQSSPSANGHRIAFESVRSVGYVAQMDTETRTSGFTRSVVMKAGLAPRDVLAGAAGSASGVGSGPVGTSRLALEPTLAGTGISLSTPDIASLPSAGSVSQVNVPFTARDRKALPKNLQASVRWDPIDVPIVPVGPTAETGAPDAGAKPPAPTDLTPTPGVPAADVPTAKTPAASAPAADAPAADRSAASAPTFKAPAADAPDAPKVQAPGDDLDLVVPERLGDVVSPVAVKIGKTSLAVPLTFPAAAGRYRLTVTLHDADGVAYDATTQAQMSSLIIRVTGDFDGAIQAAPTAGLAAGTGFSLGVRVTNLGKTQWGNDAVKPVSNLSGWIPARAATVIGRWIPLSEGAALPTDPAVQTASSDLASVLAPGKSAIATLALTAPSAAGQYLLLLDVMTPERGSLLATGGDPTIVRVTVTAAK